MRLTYLPLVGVLASCVLFVLATLNYPGGYVWTRDFVCNLFAPATPSGDVNSARLLAIAAAFVYCVSVATLFELLSRRAPDRWLASTLQIGGIGSAVYGFLIVTPMHNLMVNIAVLFYLPAFLAALALACLEGRRALLVSGLACFVLVLVNVGLYFANILWDLLPLVQKLKIPLTTAWLLLLQLAPAQSVRSVGK